MSGNQQRILAKHAENNETNCPAHCRFKRCFMITPPNPCELTPAFAFRQLEAGKGSLHTWGSLSAFEECLEDILYTKEKNLKIPLFPHWAGNCHKLGSSSFPRNLIQSSCDW